MAIKSDKSDKSEIFAIKLSRQIAPVGNEAADDSIGFKATATTHGNRANHDPRMGFHHIRLLVALKAKEKSVRKARCTQQQAGD
ncbi:MAG: hypothetical protein WAT93_02385 [Pontixanthobacter sp.]